jgi:NAD(P)-dependent dehydrogenase (short-subunit alcohol dehydrogenase family)
MAPVNEQGRALVVGGASGIGRACVEALAADGWDVLLVDLAPDAAAAGVLAAAQADVRDADAVQRAVDELADGSPIGAVVYAAGMGKVAPVDEITPHDWQLVLDVNLTGAFHTVRAVTPHLREGAAIVLISSIDSVAPVSGLAHYCAAKAGVDSLARSVALELGPRGIRCNVVAPGVVRTPLMAPALDGTELADAFVALTPLGAIADPPQVAGVVGFLVSPAAAWITGVRVPVDGGLSLREHPSMLREPKKRTAP